MTESNFDVRKSCKTLLNQSSILLCNCVISSKYVSKIFCGGWGKNNKFDFNKKREKI